MAGFSIKDFMAALNDPNGIVMQGRGDTVAVNGKSFTLPKAAVQLETPAQNPTPAPKQDLSSVAERLGVEAGQAPGANVAKSKEAPAVYEEVEEEETFLPGPVARHMARREQRMAEKAARKFSFDMRFAKRRKRFNDALMHDLEGRDLSNPDERNYMYETWGATFDDNGNINIDEMPSPDVLKQIRR